MTSGEQCPIDIRYQGTNPGQFFACCGLMELTGRLWDGVEGWFERDVFRFRSLRTDVVLSLAALLTAVAGAPLRQVDPEDEGASPVEIAEPFGLLLDWWRDGRAGGDRLKVWAGSMRVMRIARAMQAALKEPDLQNGDLLDQGRVVRDPAEPDKKKVEPFYFDARRGSNARPIDLGFSPDSLQMTSTAYPAVEFLCLVGLQRFRPWATGTARVFDYYTWRTPLPLEVAPLAACGLLETDGREGFRFENAFRTDQRKHKGFASATPT